jgi:hypothetical protein
MLVIATLALSVPDKIPCKRPAKKVPKAPKWMARQTFCPISFFR